MREDANQWVKRCYVWRSSSTSVVQFTRLREYRHPSILMEVGSRRLTGEGHPPSLPVSRMDRRHTCVEMGRSSRCTARQSSLPGTPHRQPRRRSDYLKVTAAKGGQSPAETKNVQSTTPKTTHQRARAQFPIPNDGIPDSFLLTKTRTEGCSGFGMVGRLVQPSPDANPWGSALRTRFTPVGRSFPSDMSSVVGQSPSPEQCYQGVCCYRLPHAARSGHPRPLAPKCPARMQCRRTSRRPGTVSDLWMAGPRRNWGAEVVVWRLVVLHDVPIDSRWLLGGGVGGN